MTVKSKPFYWLECDTPDCGACAPDEGDDYSAYSDLETAILCASESDWLIVNGKHYCPDHAFSVCRECGGDLTKCERDIGEYTCLKCAPELAEED